MKIGIAYATRRTAATVHIVGWMKSSLEEQENTVVCENVDRFDHSGCDAYIGSGVTDIFTNAINRPFPP